MYTDLMASQEKETINDKINIKGPERPFQWGDEMGIPEVESELEDDNRSYTSVAKLLEDEKKIEIIRLEKHIQKSSSLGTSKKSSKIVPSGEPVIKEF